MPQSDPIWTPSRERIESSNLTQFIKHINMQGESISDYQSLHRWSVEDKKRFWLEVWQYCDVIGFMGDCIHGEGVAKWGKFNSSRDTIWFPQAQLNYAENLLSYAFQQPNELAIQFKNECGKSKELTWQQLADQVSIMQQWLKQNGVEKGDVVAGYLPYIPESVVAMLAATSLGAIWTSTSPDFGVESVVERFGQVKPKILFCCNGYNFNGKTYEMHEKNAEIASSISSIENICQIEYLVDNQASEQSNSHFSDWEAILASYIPRGIRYKRVAFNDPLYVLYSSGTTGKPKCIVHSVGGTTLNHLKEHQLHSDIQPRDKVFYYTTCGWMMWNWHVSTLASGATLVIYDGSPMHPIPSALWQLAQDLDVTLFGTSAKYLEAMEKQQISPSLHYDLPKLRTLCSTGSVLYPEQFEFVYSHIKADLHLASISGGTDICGCFVLGSPISPVYKGECQSAGLGLEVAAFNESGEKVVEQRSELVCLNSFPNQPLGFWQDDGEKYHNAYWNKYPNAWHHGDDIKITEHNGVKFYGRSDTTLNPGGVRIGTGEVYRQVNKIESILDSVAVAQLHEGDERIVLFVKLASEQTLSPELIDEIKTTLRSNCTPRHVPSKILTVSDIPRTKSGKIVELAVKQVVNGQKVNNLGAIENPEILEEIAQTIRS